ncbi:flagellar basal body rod protein FlgB [mine drainage metagenome]|uniref:Flagellar basal body rod protein FlgB n=1 Tax=mine drainage metagenome TaxID=410659 RepID=A0A1J5REQ0_9ZZZZ
MFEDLTLLAMARRSMDWLTRRQEVLAENVANADTPKYQAKDLKALSFKNLFQAQGQQPLQAVVDNPMHIQPPVEKSPYQAEAEKAPGETKPNGNTVLLEDQMQKIGDVKNNYQLALNLLEKNIKMLETAVDKNG